MRASLTLRYQFSLDDDFGWLDAKVRAAGTGEAGGWWVQWQDVEEWAAKLAACPLAGPVEGDWGYGLAGEWETVVGIWIEPAGEAGALDVRVTLADSDDPRIRFETGFRTRYPDLQRFAAAIGRMMKRKAGEAVLAGREPLDGKP
ncbi:MAG: hypothetical protein ABWX67_16185 [Allosphingosinicella sp.]